MAHKRKNRRRRSQAAKLERQYQYRSRSTEEMLRDESYREKQSEYMKVVKQKQKEAAETIVFITSVSDLRQDSNRLGLGLFLAQTYGPFKFCRKYHYHKPRRNPFPPALVRFERASDASKIFGGESLLRVDFSIRVACPLGHGGYIMIHRFGLVDEIVQEELTGFLILKVFPLVIGIHRRRMH